MPNNMLSHFHLIPECDGQTDGWTERIAISILRVILNNLVIADVTCRLR